jgi:hypothetical protein
MLNSSQPDLEALLNLVQEIEDYCQDVTRSAEIHLETAEYLESEAEDDVGCFDLGMHFGELKGATNVSSFISGKIERFRDAFTSDNC